MSLQLFLKLNRIDDTQDSNQIVVDSSNNNRTGTVRGNTGIVDDHTFGKCIKLDGNGDYIELSSNKTSASTLDLPTRTITVSGWVYVEQFTEWATILGFIQDNGDEEHGWNLGIYANQHFYWALSAERPAGLKYLSSHSSFELNTWYHVAATYDGTTMHLYVNGEKEGTSQEQSGSISYTDSWFRIGQYKDDNEEYSLNGRLTHIRMYNNVLSVEDIIADMQRDLSVYSRFVAHHLPPLDSGNYTLQVSQKLTIEGNEKNIPLKTQKFTVLGERFSLKPEDIQSVFPPDGGFGNYQAVLPHVVLNRSTLPWERSAKANANETPWLAVLLFDDNEKPVSKIVKWQDMLTDSSDPVNPYSFVREYGQHDDDQLTVIEVKKLVLENILPSVNDLKWLAHVRRSYRDLAVVLGNRLPKAGESNTAHLVSLETFYENDKAKYNTTSNDKTIRLISLKQWSFANEDPNKTLKEQLKHLNCMTLRLPVTYEDLKNPQLLKTLLFDLVMNSSLCENLKPSLLTTYIESNKFDALISDLFNDHEKMQKFLETELLKLQIQENLKTELSSIIGKNLETKLLKIGKDLKTELLKIREDLKTELPKIQEYLKTELLKMRNNLETELLKMAVGKLKTLIFYVINHPNLPKDLKTELLNKAKAAKSEPLISHLVEKSNLSEDLKTNLCNKTKAGKIAFAHTYPGGSTTLSWYRSPLLPVANESISLPLPTDAADKLLLYDAKFGILDTSYAAAWELGRQLALQSKSFATAYYNWKRQWIQQCKQREQESNAKHPYKKAKAEDSCPLSLMPEIVKKWLQGLNTLKAVPFHYLVPDEKMLPPESAAFFYTDYAWLKCLVDGACSISRITDSDIEYAGTIQTRIQQELLTASSGMMIRSNLVSEWNDLLAEADVVLDGTPHSDRQPLRFEKLSPTIMIALFEGEIQKVKIHHSPDVLHFGFERNDSNQLSKKLRHMAGDNTGVFYPSNDVHHISTTEIQNHEIIRNTNTRKVEIDKLAKTIITNKFVGDEPSPLRNGQITVDQFAFQMIETVPAVVFEKKE